MSQPITYVFDKSFFPVGAEKNFYEGDIPVAETGWYLRYLNAQEDHDCEPVPKMNVVLTKEQEALLFWRFNYAKYRVGRLQRRQYAVGVCKKRCGPTTTTFGRKVLYWTQAARECRNHIVAMNLALVIKIAAKVGSRNRDMEEHIASGNAKLLPVIEKFNYRNGTKFSTYAWWAVIREIINDRKKVQLERKRVPISYDFEHSPDDARSGTLKDTLEDKSDDPELRENIALMTRMLDENLAHLTPREQFVIRKRYCERKPNGGRYVFEEVGKMIDLSRTGIQLEEQGAIRKMREAWYRLTEPVRRS